MDYKDYKEKYDKALEVAKRKLCFDNAGLVDYYTPNDLYEIFPELKEPEDEKMWKLIKKYAHYNISDSALEADHITREHLESWLEKQCKPNPYSGTSFDYNGHTWGMCARDNGVEILFDGELKAFLSLEKSFIYPIHPQPELPKTE